ncbi:hypothetical protein SBRCBS47491_003570 [Sporothrix bragantina]|uniref:DRBM domain-containing protein n=1 Tax=Sporothrix bragantina TaxID=671064 RepID=A0ABP0BGC4_9PEZI
MGSQLQSSKYVASYDSLKAWIYDQEDYERRTGQPAPLTEEQLEAMAILVPPTPPPPSVFMQEGGNMLETDFVSMLMRFIQARKGFVPPEYVDEQLSSNSFGSPQWRTRCRLPREAPDRWFPDMNEPRSQDSIFQNKKASRQHAARCAVEWLITEGLMSSNGDYIAPRAQSTTYPLAITRTAMAKTEMTSTIPVARSPPKLSGSHIVPTTKADMTSTINQSSSSPNSSGNVDIAMQDAEGPKGKPNVSPPSSTVQSMASWEGKSYANSGTWTTVVAGADNGIRAINKVGNSSGRTNSAGSHFRDDGDYEGTKTQLLDSLCKMRKLGSPSYNLTPVSEDAQGVFNGHIVFPSLGAKGSVIAPILPEGVGEVRGVFTKKAAKEKIAEGVLQYMMNNMLGSVEAQTGHV